MKISSFWSQSIGNVTFEQLQGRKVGKLSALLSVTASPSSTDEVPGLHRFHWSIWPFSYYSATIRVFIPAIDSNTSETGELA